MRFLLLLEMKKKIKLFNHQITPTTHIDLDASCTFRSFRPCDACLANYFKDTFFLTFLITISLAVI